MNDTELYHYGVLGMKWGVRRKRPKSIYDRVAGSKIRSAYHKRGAANVYKVNKRYADAQAKAANRKMRAADKQINKIAERSKKGGFKSFKQAVEYANKGNGLIAKAKEYERIGQQYTKMSETYSKKLKDIKNGTLKAGRDYIYKVEHPFLGSTISFSVYDRKGKKTASYGARIT